MNLNSVFQEGITEIIEINHWRQRNEFTFIFQTKYFNFVVLYETTIGKFRVLLYVSALI